MQLDRATPFGRWVKQRRKELDLTQAALSEQAGCAVDTLRRIESGRLRPSRQLAEMLAGALEVPPEERDGFVQWARLPIERAPDAAKGRAPDEGGFEHPPTNLPSPLTPFIGRERELERARGLLWRAEVRLVTLTGPPGIGKTRLSMEVAAALLDDYGDGVFFVPLAPVTDPSLVVPAVAQTLGVRETPGKPIEESLKGHLQGKRLLLVLDNFEQVMGASLPLVDLLTACPQVKALVTSREALRVRGEKAMPVPVMQLPDEQEAYELSDLAKVESVALFLQRTEDVNLGFSLERENAQAVASICRHLEGLPLAIELAASRMDVLSPQGLLDRLGRRLQMLTTGIRDLPPHQRTLRQAIEWSHDLLSVSDRILLRRLAVFAGGFTLESAEAVCDWPEGDRLPVMEGVSSLAAKSLVQRSESAGGEPRFLLLETIREFAWERLVESGDKEGAQERHAAYFIALAEKAEPHFMGAEGTTWLGVLETEHDNLRVALRWSREEGHLDFATRLGLALWNFWELRGHNSEGYEHLSATVAARDSGVRDADFARLLYLTGRFTMHRDVEAALRLHQESYAVAEKLTGRAERSKAISDALTGLWVVAFRACDYELARRYGEERVAICRVLGDKTTLAYALNNVGITSTFQGDRQRANEVYAEALEIQRENDNHVGIASILINMGELARAAGEDATARTCYEESLEIWRRLGRSNGTAIAVENLGYIALHENDPEMAMRYFRESMSIFKQLGGKQGMLAALVGIAGAWSLSGSSDGAACLLGAVDTLLTEFKLTFEPSTQSDYDRILGKVREELGESTFAASQVTGRAMTMEDAVGYVLADGEGC